MGADLQELRQKNISLAKRLVRESVSPDQFVINAVTNIEDLQRIQNTLSKRVRDWYALYFPEADKRTPSNEEFITLVLTQEKDFLIKHWQVKECMGADLEKKELEEIKHLAERARDLFEEEKYLVKYLDKTLKAYAPNLYEVAGGTIGAKLLRGAGSLKRLAMMRSSTIQLIGAEKALFRHIKTGARPPKYGYLLQHPLVQKAAKEDRGKIARALADKIFIACRVDFFKGEFVGDKLLKEVEEKVEVRK